MSVLRRLAFIAPLLVAPLAIAQQVTPTYVQIDPARTQAGQTSLTNLSQRSQSYSVRAVKWTIENGKPVLTDTKDIILSPAAFILAPGASQVVRIGIRKRVEGTELTYRVLLEEQPTQDSPTTQQQGANGVVLNLQQTTTYSVPVYVTPANTAPRLGYSVKVDGADLLLTTQNTGTRSQLMNNPEVSAGTQKLSLNSVAVLAGSVQTWKLAGWAVVTGPLKLTYSDRAGQQYSADIPR